MEFPPDEQVWVPVASGYEYEEELKPPIVIQEVEELRASSMRVYNHIPFKYLDKEGIVIEGEY